LRCYIKTALEELERKVSFPFSSPQYKSPKQSKKINFRLHLLEQEENADCQKSFAGQ
jgi:hypothetical protein